MAKNITATTHDVIIIEVIEITEAVIPTTELIATIDMTNVATIRAMVTMEKDTTIAINMVIKSF